MSTEILMPALSPTMTEGNLSKWLIKKGDAVKAGDLIAEIETDKATMEVEAVDEGVVLDLLFKEGEANIPVNKAIAIIGDPNEKVEVKKEAPIEKVIEEKKIEKNIETKIENNKADIIDTTSTKIEEDRKVHAPVMSSGSKKIMKHRNHNSTTLYERHNAIKEAKERKQERLKQIIQQEKMKEIYLNQSKNKLKEKTLKKCLKRDIWWDPKKCKKLGLVDTII